MVASLRTKRIYDQPAADDGTRVLVDRIWPRGITKQAAAIDHWLKDIAPSTDLRKWFGHEPERWPEFQQRFRSELEANPAAVGALRKLAAGEGTVTLLFAARDAERNNAEVIKAYLTGAKR
jgi:uncharacterized protein YeaO (DUF488 family)